MRGMKLLALIAFVLQGPQRTSPVENDRNDEAASKQFGNEYGSIQVPAWRERSIAAREDDRSLEYQFNAHYGRPKYWEPQL